MWDGDQKLSEHELLSVSTGYVFFARPLATLSTVSNRLVFPVRGRIGLRSVPARHIFHGQSLFLPPLPARLYNASK